MASPHAVLRYTRRLARASKSNFYYAFLFLPRDKRAAITTAYAFCRQTDDLIDDAASLPAAVEALKGWREELDRCYAGTATHPTFRALAQILGRFPIPQEYLADVIAGCEMDATLTRYATFEDLALYCYRVASCVGLICIEIFGYRNPLTRQYAVDMGTAFQLTNIIRDVGQDARRGRIYLPQEDLRRFGVSEADLLAGRGTPAFADLMRFQAERAKRFFARAEAPAEDRPHLLAAEIMRSIYRALLQTIEDAGYPVLGDPITLSRPRRISLALRTWVTERWVA
jgi:15-cis-phytoene synthase